MDATLRTQGIDAITDADCGYDSVHYTNPSDLTCCRCATDGSPFAVLMKNKKKRKETKTNKETNSPIQTKSQKKKRQKVRKKDSKTERKSEKRQKERQ